MTQGPGMRMPGEMLAAARETAGMTLAQVAEATKIPPASLRAIEQDEYHKISGDLYVKSFLRLYAETVGLDPEEILDVYRRYVGEVAVAADGAEVPGWSEEEVEVRGIGLPWNRILPISVAVVLAVLAVVYFRGCGGGEAADPAGETVPPPSVPDSAVVDSTQVQAVPEEDRASSDAGSGEPAADPPPVVARPAPTPAVAADLQPAPVGAADLEFANGRRYPVVLRVVCEGPQDLRVKVDGQGRHLPAFWPADMAAAPRLADERPEPGRVYAVREGLAVFWGGEDNFSLILERLDGVKVTTNGAARDLDGVRPGKEWILDMHPAGFFVKP